MRRYRAALILGALALACQDQRAVYSAAVMRAQDRWAVACGVRPRPASVILLDVVTFPCGTHAPAAAGCTDADGHVWLATNSTAPVDGLVLHELGHVLGASHLATGVPGVMTATVNSDQWRPCLTVADLDAVAICTTFHPECGVKRP